MSSQGKLLSLCFSSDDRNYKSTITESLKMISKFDDIDCVVIVQDLYKTLDNTEFDIQFLENKGVNVIYQPGSGLSRSRNLGVSLCNGEYIWVLDGDVTFRLGVISELLGVLKNYSSAICALIVSVLAIEDGNYLKYFRTKEAIWDFHIMRVLSIGIIFNRRAQAFSNVWFDERLGLGTLYGGTEENDFLLRLKRASGLSVASTSLAPLVHSSDSAERSIPTLNVLYARGRIARQLGGFFGLALAGYWVIRFSVSLVSSNKCSTARF